MREKTNFYNRLKIFVVLGIVVWLFPACNGMFGFIYDEPIVDSEYGFIEFNSVKNTGTVYVDARSYTQWIYLDFEGQTIDSVDFVNNPKPEPARWDIALHRYDVKTNGGEALSTEYNDFNQLWNLSGLPAGTFKPDQQNDSVLISFDMSNGNLQYFPSHLNRVFNWVTFSLETMPPTYSDNLNFFIVRLKNGKLLALRLESYTNDQALKGFMTIKYCYPLEFN